MKPEAEVTNLTPEQVAKLELKKAVTAKKVQQQKERRARQKAAIETVNALTSNQKTTAGHIQLPSAGKLFKTLIVEHLSRIESGYTKSNAQRIVEKITKQALDGDTDSQRLLLDRVDGKVTNQEDDSNKTTGLTIIAPDGQFIINGNSSSVGLIPESPSEHENPEPIKEPISAPLIPSTTQ